MKKLLRNTIYFISIVFMFYSCGGSDEEEVISIPLEPFSTQYVIENDSIIQYMKTQNHF